MRSHHSAVSLAPLDRSQVRKMVGEIAARHAPSKEFVEGVSERTGGVPLFVEEVTRLLIERGEEGGARAIPLTLQQSLAARLDRLGGAREIAQIGAVLGRDFAYALLREVAERDEAELQAGLERLAEADILFVEGLPPKANYRFKHALCLHETAIDYWRKAGESAAKRAANIEAVDHLRRGLALLEALPDRSAHADQELALLVVLGPALMATRTSAAPEIQEIYARARELARDADKAAELFTTLWGLSTIAISGGNHEVARACAAELFGIAHKQNDVGYLLQAHHAAWAAEQPIGNLTAAHEHTEAALRLYDKDAHRDHAVLYGGHDPGTCAYITDARVLQVRGQLDHALAQLEKGLALARELEHPPTLVHTLGFAAEACFVFRDPAKSLNLVDEWLPLAMKFGSALGVANATMLRGWANVMLGEIKAGLAEMRDGLDRWRSMGSNFYAPTRLGGAAATFLAAGEVGQGAAILGEAFEAILSSGEHWYEAELYRLQGLTFAENSPARLAEAEACFGTAINIARSQGARLFELRAAMALNRLPCDREERKRQSHSQLDKWRLHRRVCRTRSKGGWRAAC
jgi:predicted ATPase